MFGKLSLEAKKSLSDSKTESIVNEEDEVRFFLKTLFFFFFCYFKCGIICYETLF